jgi:hypothetical protein
MSNDNEPPFNDGCNWRQRAREARDLAERIPDPEAKQALFRAADDYEWLADRAEELLARDLAEQQTKPTT